MAYIDRGIEEYPYQGRFYRIGFDMDVPLDQRVPIEKTVLDTECDIQEAGSNVTGGITNASFSIYFPFDTEGEMPVRRGDQFKGEIRLLKHDAPDGFIYISFLVIGKHQYADFHSFFFKIKLIHSLNILAWLSHMTAM